MDNQTKKPNWIEACRRLFYVVWAILATSAFLLVLITNKWDEEGFFVLALACIAPYPLMLGVRWIYAGLVK